MAAVNVAPAPVAPGPAIVLKPAQHKALFKMFEIAYCALEGAVTAQVVSSLGDLFKHLGSAEVASELLKAFNEGGAEKAWTFVKPRIKELAASRDATICNAVSSILKTALEHVPGLDKAIVDKCLSWLSVRDRWVPPSVQHIGELMKCVCLHVCVCVCVCVCVFVFAEQLRMRWQRAQCLDGARLSGQGYQGTQRILLVNCSCRR